jgi:hypothetical protein
MEMEIWSLPLVVVAIISLFICEKHSMVLHNLNNNKEK